MEPTLFRRPLSFQNCKFQIGDHNDSACLHCMARCQAWFGELFIPILGGWLLKVYLWDITKGKARVDHEVVVVKDVFNGVIF